MNCVPGLAPVILAPSHLARGLVQVNADPVVLADLGPAQPREEWLAPDVSAALVMHAEVDLCRDLHLWVVVLI